MHILLIETDPANAGLIKQGLDKDEFLIHHALDSKSGLWAAQNSVFDMIIVDAHSDSEDVTNTISVIRQISGRIPVLVLSPQNMIEDLIPILTHSETDFVLKPVTIIELRARMMTLMKRSAEISDTSKICTAGVTLDLVTREVYRGSEKIVLQNNEFELLELFMRNAGNVITKTQILKKIWDYNFDPQTNVVDVLVWRLRSKIDKHFPQKIIQTVRGVGYVFRPI